MNEADPVDSSDRAERKSNWMRGRFISMTSHSEDGIAVVRTGKASNSVLMSGLELTRALSSEVRLDRVFRDKAEELAEVGKVHFDTSVLGQSFSRRMDPQCQAQRMKPIKNSRSDDQELRD